MRRLVLKGMAWVLAETLVRNILLFGFTVALARLLTPAEFGVVAMLSLLVGVANTLAEGGMGSALVQAQDPTQEDISTLFWTQVGGAFVMALLLAASGPMLAAWFREPILSSLVIAYGVNIVVTAPASLQSSLMMKALDFRTPAIVVVIAQVIGGSAAVIAATAGLGPWAIVLQAMISGAVTTGLLWLLSPWRPSWVYSMESLRRHLGYGVFVVGAGILGEVERRVGSLVLGRFAGATAAGQYQRAASLELLMSRVLSGVVTRVAFPAFSAIQADRSRLVAALREATFVNFAATALVLWSVALTAEPLVALVFGDQWSPSAGALQAMCVAGGFYPVFAVLTKALRALGHARLVFMHYLVRAAGMTFVAIFLSERGFVVMSWAQTIFILATLSITCLSAARKLGFALMTQVADLAPVVLAGAVMAACGLLARPTVINQSDVLQILVIGVASAAGFTLTLILLSVTFPMPAAKMALATIRSATKGPS